MEGYAAESIAANRKILRKRTFRNIDRKAPKAKRKIAKNTIELQQQAAKMKRIEQRKDIRVALTLVALILLGISVVVYGLSAWV